MAAPGNVPHLLQDEDAGHAEDPSRELTHQAVQPAQASPPGEWAGSGPGMPLTSQSSMEGRED